MSPVRKEKTSESFVILRIILSEAGHQTVISITDYELVEIKKIVKKDKDGNESLKLFLVESNETVPCPVCSHELVYREFLTLAAYPLFI